MPGQAVSGPSARDPGLQPERTSLAWQRTVVSVTLASVVLALGQLRAGVPVVAVAAAALAVLAVAPGVLRPRRGRGLVEQDGGAGTAARTAAAATAPREVWPLLVRTTGIVAALGLLGAVATVAHVVRA